MSFLDYLKGRYGKQAQQVGRVLNDASNRYNPFDSDFIRADAQKRQRAQQNYQNRPASQMRPSQFIAPALGDTAKQVTRWTRDNFIAPTINSGTALFEESTRYINPLEKQRGIERAQQYINSGGRDRKAVMELAKPRRGFIGEAWKRDTLGQNVLMTPDASPITRKLLGDAPQKTLKGLGSDMTNLAVTLAKSTGIDKNAKTQQAGYKYGGQLAGLALASLDIVSGGGKDDMLRSVAKSSDINQIAQITGIKDPATLKKLVESTDVKKIGGILDNFKKPTGKVDVGYHGTRKNFDKFAFVGNGKGYGGTDTARALYFTSSPDDARLFGRKSEPDGIKRLETAIKNFNGDDWNKLESLKTKLAEIKGYGASHYYNSDRGVRVIESNIDTSNFKTIDFGGKRFDEDVVNKILKQAKADGKSGVKITNIIDNVSDKPATQYAVFDVSKLSQPTGAKTRSNLKLSTQNTKKLQSPELSPKAASNASETISQSRSLEAPIADDFNTNDYIKQLTKSQKQAAKGNSILDKVAGFKQEVKSKFVDRFSILEDTLTKVEKEGKLQILPTSDIRPQLDRVLRSDSIATQFIKDRGLAKVIQDVPDIKAFDQYLIAKQAQDVAAKGIKTGRDLAKDKALISSLSPQYEKFAQKVYQYNRDVLGELADSGMISKSLRDKLIKEYPNYVPLNRVFNEIEREAIGGFSRGGSVASVGTQKVVKRLKGSEREIENPIESILTKTSQAIEQSEKNRAANMLISYKDLPGNPFGIKPISETTPGNGTISAFIDGKKHMFEIDPEFARAAKDMGKQQIGFLGQLFAAPTRLLKLGATGLNIPFVASNVVKDQVFATINSSKALKTSLANPGNFLKSLYSVIKQDKLYDDWVKSGSSFTSFDLSRNQLKPTVGRIRGQKNVGTKVLYEITHPQDLLRSVEDIIGKSEELTRVQQFNGMKQALIKEGRTVEDATILAAKAARENTANFARGGEWTTPLNAAIPYINAGIQGSRSLVRNLKTRPVQTSAKIAALVFTPIAFATAWNTGDPKRKEAYDDIADYEKENNIIILPPNPVKDENGRWNAIKIPLTPGLSNLGSVVRRTIEGTNSIARTGTDLLAAMTSFDVSSTNKVMSQVTPQLIKPGIEGYTNTNLFTGQKIVPEYMKEYPKEMQFKDGTSGSARILGKALNASPLKVENTIRTSMGGVGQQILNASDKTLNKLGVIPEDQIGGKGVTEQIQNRFTSAAGGQQLSNLFDGKQTSNDGKRGIKDSKGKLWVTVDGKPKSFKTQEEADVAIAKNEVEGMNVGDRKRIGDKIIYKDKDGEVRTKSISDLNKQVSDYKLDKTIKMAKENNDWKTLAESYALKEKSLLEDIANLDPEVDQITILRKQEQLEKLQEDWIKYQKRGYISKNSGGGSKKRPQLDISAPKSTLKLVKMNTSIPQMSSNLGGLKGGTYATGKPKALRTKRMV